MTVAIDLIGAFRVRVGDRTIPASAWARRDAAHLVKVLALQDGHQLHRERLMDLLWPDLPVSEAAPRLHKAAHYARRALGRSDTVVLRDEMVSLLPGETVDVDVTDFERRAAEAAEDGGAEAAAAVLDAFPGDPLPADVYIDWAEEVRERVRARRVQLLRQARRWSELVALDPTDEPAQLELIRELARTGERSAALRQYARMEQVLGQELGVEPGPEARRLREELAVSRPVPRRRIEQEVRFCRTADGVTLAYACSGTGPPLVKAANWLTHIDHDWHSPVWRHWLQELSRRFRLVRYDERGCGLSDWDIPPPSFDDWVDDLATVVDAAGLDRFPLLGISQGAAVAIAYTARHPERVTKLVLYGGYARGRISRAASAEDRRRHELQVELAALGWGTDDPAFRQVFTAQFMPGAPKELWDSFNELQKLTTSPDNAARVLALTGHTDVTDIAPHVHVPAVVLHARSDHRPPFDEGRLMASLLPNSRFVPLESQNHILLADEPAWRVFLREVERFLGEDLRPR